MATSAFAASPIARYMLDDIIACLSGRPGEGVAKTAARTLDITTSVMAHQPRDPVEMMLAGLAVTHAQLIQDTVNEAVHGQDNVHSNRTKSTIAALDRAMMGFLRELRLARKRALEGEVADAAIRDVQSAEASPSPGVEASKPSPQPVKSSIPGLVCNSGPRPSPPGRVAIPEPPVPLSRRSATSIAAMMMGAPPLTLPRAGQLAATKRTAREFARPNTPPFSLRSSEDSAMANDRLAAK